MSDQYSGEKIVGLMNAVDDALRGKPDTPNSNTTKTEGEVAPAQEPAVAPSNCKHEQS